MSTKPRTKKPTVEPRTELTMSEAFESLNYFDLQAIRREWKVSLSDIESRTEEVTYGVVWLLETRVNPAVKIIDVKNMTLGDINAYFTVEDPDPESEQGKAPNAD